MSAEMKRAVTFGEIMLRLKAPSHERLLQSSHLEATFGGGEANVAVSLARFGVESDFVSVLPHGELGDAAMRALSSHGVSTSVCLRTPGRLGIYFLENGSNQRPSKVIYDRSDSAFARCAPESYAWHEILHGAQWFHTSGITPAVSKNAAEAVLAGVQAARTNGLTVSIDLNFRKKLWNWGRAARDVMPEIVRHADFVIGNEVDLQEALGLEGLLPSSLSPDPLAYEALAREARTRFPNLKAVALSLRDSTNADFNRWRAVISTRDGFFISRSYDLTDIVDRVGSGDAFAAGLIYSLITGARPESALEFATAAGCIKHTIPGDFNLTTVEEVKAVAAGGSRGRIER